MRARSGSVVGQRVPESVAQRNPEIRKTCSPLLPPQLRIGVRALFFSFVPFSFIFFFIFLHISSFFLIFLHFFIFSFFFHLFIFYFIFSFFSFFHFFHFFDVFQLSSPGPPAPPPLSPGPPENIVFYYENLDLRHESG